MLRINPRNVKAWYRAASASYALDKVAEAIDACQSGLQFEPANQALKVLLAKVEKRKDYLAELERTRLEKEQRARLEHMNLQKALKQRKIITRTTERPPEIPEASIALEDPLDPDSVLSFPAMLLYPVDAQTDFIKQFREDETIIDHLSYILPLPWDDRNAYSSYNVECYMETTEGGLIKAGKKLSLLKLLTGGKLEVVDGLVRINVLPKDEVSRWIEEFKFRRGKQ